MLLLRKIYRKRLRLLLKLNILYINGDLNSLVTDRKIDITDISFKDNYFDFIICNNILEHV